MGALQKRPWGLFLKHFMNTESKLSLTNPENPRVNLSWVFVWYI